MGRSIDRVRAMIRAATGRSGGPSTESSRMAPNPNAPNHTPSQNAPPALAVRRLPPRAKVRAR
jgi:hypothetical protein